MHHARRPKGLTDIEAQRLARALTVHFDERVTFTPKPTSARPKGLSACFWPEIDAHVAPKAPKQPWETKKAA